MADPFRTLANAMDPKAPKPKVAPKETIVTGGPVRQGTGERSKYPAMIAAIEAAKKRQHNYLTKPPVKK